MDSGRVLATDTPAELIKARGVATLEDAFISYLEEATGSRAAGTEDLAPSGETDNPVRPPTPKRSLFSLQRLFAYTIRETLELLRDPIRLGFGLFGTALADAGVRIWNFDRCQQSLFRRARSGSEP